MEQTRTPILIDNVKAGDTIESIGSKPFLVAAIEPCSSSVWRHIVPQNGPIGCWYAYGTVFRID
jgi:hypothetical protein